MEEIQEMCLNELLGISTKRLMSIINATKCPTDTESDTDSDVEHKEGIDCNSNFFNILNHIRIISSDHVSLEEISSDSEIEGGKCKFFDFILILIHLPFYINN